MIRVERHVVKESVQTSFAKFRPQAAKSFCEETLLSKTSSKKLVTKRPPSLFKSLVRKTSEETVNGGWINSRALERAAIYCERRQIELFFNALKQNLKVKTLLLEVTGLYVLPVSLRFKEIKMETYDDDLSRFEADGAAPLPVTNDQAYVECDGARIWYASYGSGSPVILLHGGLGHSGNWGYQVPALIRNGYRAVLIDSRGHGRSTRDARPFMYELMAADVLAVMDALHLEKAGLVGWSDGATIALILAMKAPTRVAGVYFSACNMDPSGVKQITEPNPILDRCLGRHAKDYARLSATPDQFKAFAEAVSLMMQTQPNYSAHDLAQISVPVAIVHSEHDEFIKREHAEYLARSIPHAELVNLRGVSHFAPLQRPDQFNIAMLAFLGKVLP